MHRDLHNVTTNDYSNNRLAQYPDFLSYLEQHHPAWVTARFTTWDAIYIHQPTGADIDFFHNYTSDGDNIAASNAAAFIAGAHPIYTQDPDTIFFYLSMSTSPGTPTGSTPAAPATSRPSTSPTSRSDA